MLDRAGVPSERRRFERSVDARYERQSYELPIPASRCARSTRPRSTRSRKCFTSATCMTYGHDNRREPVQIVSVRVAAIGAIAPLSIRDIPAPAGADACKGTRRALVSRDRTCRCGDI